VVEIGTHHGGSLYCWAWAAAPDAHLVSIDLPDPAEGMGANAETDRRLPGFLRAGQRLTCIRADSHAPSTRAELVAALGGHAVDFLWIDGDHSDAGVRADWAMYAPLVRPGGLVAFHDIHPDPGIPGNQAYRLWRELRRAYPVREVIDQDQPGGVGTGIGMLTVPAGGL
jgi:predicted O-methyltransferase YrrM